MLRRIGLSNKALSSYEIKKEMEKYGSSESQTPYVYEMIKNLYPLRRSQYLLLVRLDRIPGSIEDESQLLSALDRHFDLNLKRDEKNITFENTEDSIIIQSKSNSTTVKIDKEDVHTLRSGYITIIGEDRMAKSFPLHYTKDGILFFDRYSRDLKPRLPYLDRLYRPKISYLDVKLDVLSNRIISEKQEEMKDIEELYLRKHPDELFSPSDLDPKYRLLSSQIAHIQENPRKWRYVLNVRGLVMYILGEIREEKSKKRIHNKRISNVLMNLSGRSKEKMPFLIYYETFRQMYKELTEIEKLPEYYEVEVLKKIAEELQYLVYTADIAVLKYWVTRRYSSEISYYITTASQTDLLGLPYNLSLTIRDYQMENLYAMKKYLEDHLKEIDYRYGMLELSTKGADLQIYF